MSSTTAELPTQSAPTLPTHQEGANPPLDEEGIPTTDTKIKQKITLDGKPYLQFHFQGKILTLPLFRPVRVYADGIYDMFHYGHMRSLQQAKNIFRGIADELDVQLVVGVCGDKVTHKYKGKTVMDEDERTEAVRHCRYADEVVKRAPWIVNEEFMDKYKIDFVTHGNDVCLDENGNDCYGHLKKAGKYLFTRRTEGISTSGLITRIVKNYDDYIRRNLNRGYTAKELNVSVWKEAQIKIQNGVDVWKNTLKKFGTNYQIDQKLKKVKETFDNSLDHVGEILNLSHVMSFNKTEASPTSLQAPDSTTSQENSQSSTENVENAEKEKEPAVVIDNEEKNNKRKREEEVEISDETNAKRHKKNDEQK